MKIKMNVWITRDEYSTLWLHGKRPKKEADFFCTPDGFNEIVPRGITKFFDDITFENSPKEYTITFTPKN